MAKMIEPIDFEVDVMNSLYHYPLHESFSYLAGKIGWVRIIPVLLQGMKNQDPTVRENTTTLFAFGAGKIPQASRENVISALVQALKDSNNHVRAQAARSLEELSNDIPKGKIHEVAVHLIQAQPDKDEEVHHEAFRALSALEATTVVNALLEVITIEENPEVVRRAWAKLGFMIPHEIPNDSELLQKVWTAADETMIANRLGRENASIVLQLIELNFPEFRPQSGVERAL